MNYYVIQMKKNGITGPDYVYGPFSQEEAEKWQILREEMYSNQCDIFTVLRLTHSKAVV
jgi:hypothetical protein